MTQIPKAQSLGPACALAPGGRDRGQTQLSQRNLEDGCLVAGSSLNLCLVGLGNPILPGCLTQGDRRRQGLRIACISLFN